MSQIYSCFEHVGVVISWIVILPKYWHFLDISERFKYKNGQASAAAGCKENVTVGWWKGIYMLSSYSISL